MLSADFQWSAECSGTRKSRAICLESLPASAIVTTASHFFNGRGYMLNYAYGLFPGLTVWHYVAITFVMVQITMLSVTLYLHRDQAHRAIELHPVLRIFFRIWIWLTSGMQTREWVAIHRKHHALCEREGDPHSPVVFGLRKVLLEGAELYKEEGKNAETIDKYGRGTPSDWLERKVIQRHPSLGIVMMVGIDVLLFGVVGITILAIQMLAMPVFAAGGINGLGHHSGYRNFETDDASTNMIPIAVLIGGEELHNNHHAFPTSAKFSLRWWEIDIGWFYIRALQAVGLCRVRRVAPKPNVVDEPRHVDLEMLQVILVNRMHVLRDYTRKVTLPVLRTERRANRSNRLLRKARKLVVCHPGWLDEVAQARLATLLANHQTLRIVHEYRERLTELWEQANVSNELLVTHLKEWCMMAEASGIKALEDFATKLRGYVLQGS